MIDELALRRVLSGDLSVDELIGDILAEAGSAPTLVKSDSASVVIKYVAGQRVHIYRPDIPAWIDLLNGLIEEGTTEDQ